MMMTVLILVSFTSVALRTARIVLHLSACREIHEACNDVVFGMHIS